MYSKGASLFSRVSDRDQWKLCVVTSSASFLVFSIQYTVTAATIITMMRIITKTIMTGIQGFDRFGPLVAGGGAVTAGRRFTLTRPGIVG
jgi:hypothetical protein